MNEPTQEQMLWRGKVMTPDEAFEQAREMYRDNPEAQAQQKGGE